MNTGERTKRWASWTGFGWALSALVLGSWLGAQEPAPPAAPSAARPKGGRVIRTVKVPVGRYEGWHKGPWTSENRREGRPKGLWQLYMHGVVDFFATPVLWQSLLGPEQSAKRWLDPISVLKTEVRFSGMPALKLNSGDSILFGRHLPIPRLGQRRGTVRVFVWLRGKDANGHGEAELLPSRTPSLEVLVHDAAGRTVATYRGPMRTRGTFGWHCYYLDVPLGANLAPASDELGGGLSFNAPKQSLRVRLKNPTGGTVWFSTPSWEMMDDTNTYTPEEKQDPTTGSLAPFPAMDELPVHLMSGQAYAHPWRFFQGEAGGAKGVPDLTTPQAIREYLREATKTDRAGSFGGAVFLGPWLYAAGKHPELLALPADWHAEFRGTLLSLQDPKTGFWGTTGDQLSMAATARVVESLWGGEGGKKPWLNYGGDLPKAERIVKTLLGARSQQQADGSGGGAWGALTYNWHEAGEPEANVCSLAATRNAVVLLRLAAAGLTRDKRAQVDQALLGAWRSVFRQCVLPDGLWKLSGRDRGPSRPAFLPRVLDLSSWLAERTDTALAGPAVDGVSMGPDGVELVWKKPTAAAYAVRIFGAPKGTAVANVHMEQMVAVIEVDGTTIQGMEPVHVAGALRDAARERWGVDIAGAGDVPLLASRLAIYDGLKGIGKAKEPLTIKLAGAAKFSFFAASVNRNGEQSKLVPIEIKGIVAEPLGDDDEEDEAPKAEGAEPAGDDAVPEI
ncbi:MAG: hypothetical protein HN380_04775 [Victivallales bacterium]|nr:hypothetical protein [Victivallales bacterium]